MCCTRWASTRSACPPSSTRSRPARIRASAPRPTSSISVASWAGWASATTPAAASPPPTSTSTSGRSGSSCRSTTRGSTRPRTRPARSPSWSPNSIREQGLSTTAGSGRSCRPVSAPMWSTSYRLVYRADSMVNWCPGLGTVLANEEVTSDGRSERGNFPVFRKRLRQWMMRITAYSDRLLDDLDCWIGPRRSRPCSATGSAGRRARRCCSAPTAGDIEVFTTRPDTLFGATYMVLAPEHELVDKLTAAAVARRCRRRGGRSVPRRRAEAVAAYRATIAAKSDLERQENKAKTGVFLGSYATNPANGQQIPVFIADYVLIGYGTGAIMAVPGGDQRDWDFAHEFGLPIIEVVAGGDISQAAYSGDGEMVNSDYLNGLSVASAKEAITERLAADGPGAGARRIQTARLAFRQAAVLGRAVPDRVRRRRPRPPAARVGAARRAARHAGLLAGAVRSRRRRQRAVAAAGQGDRLGARRARPRRRAASRTPATPT